MNPLRNLTLAFLSLLLLTLAPGLLLGLFLGLWLLTAAIRLIKHIWEAC